MEKVISIAAQVSLLTMVCHSLQLLVVPETVLGGGTAPKGRVLLRTQRLSPAMRLLHVVKRKGFMV
jgi:hypothetical protein